MMLSRISFVCAVLVAIVAVACDTMPLTAPSGSALTISAGSAFVDPGGTTQITAYVLESSGTAVQNGTTVHFSTNLGRVDPVDALTTNGYAVATFMAGDSSGVADVTATSGGTGGTTSSEHRQREWRDQYSVHDQQQRCANHRGRSSRGDGRSRSEPRVCTLGRWDRRPDSDRHGLERSQTAGTARNVCVVRRYALEFLGGDRRERSSTSHADDRSDGNGDGICGREAEHGSYSDTSRPCRRRNGNAHCDRWHSRAWVRTVVRVHGHRERYSG